MHALAAGKNVSRKATKSVLQLYQTRGLAAAASSSANVNVSGIPLASELDGVSVAKPQSANADQRQKKPTLFATFLAKKHEEVKKFPVLAGYTARRRDGQEEVGKKGSQELRRPRNRRVQGTMPSSRQNGGRGGPNGRPQVSSTKRNADRQKRKGRSGEGQSVYVKPDPALKVSAFPITNFVKAFGVPRLSKPALQSTSPILDKEIYVKPYISYAPPQGSLRTPTFYAVSNNASLALSRQREVALHHRRKAVKIVQTLSALSMSESTSDTTSTESS